MAGISFGIFFPSAGIVKVLIRHMTKGVKSVGMRRDEKRTPVGSDTNSLNCDKCFSTSIHSFSRDERLPYLVCTKKKNERFSLCQLHFIVSLCAED